MGNGVIVTGESRNAKTGKVAATYAAQTTCPADCAFRGAGCYAEAGRPAIHTARLNRCDDSAQVLAEREAAGIDALPGDVDLRIHMVGDCATADAARTVSGAAERYQSRGGRVSWTYTHAWRDVPRAAWGAVSVLASCETLTDAACAMGCGWAAAVVVESHPDDGKAWDAGPFRVVPCPNQTRGVTCVDCRLCLDADGLRRCRQVIAFAAHGARVATETVRRANARLAIVE